MSPVTTSTVLANSENLRQLPSMGSRRLRRSLSRTLQCTLEPITTLLRPWIFSDGRVTPRTRSSSLLIRRMVTRFRSVYRARRLQSLAETAWRIWIPMVFHGQLSTSRNRMLGMLVCKSNGIVAISRSVEETVVSETSLAASAPIRTGRLYVNVDGRVNTGLALVNNENVPAVISFYFTDANGLDFGHGSFTLEAKHSISPFVNQAPFNLRTSMQGTLTFNSSLPVTVTGIRGLTNERGELLMTTQPVSSLDAPTTHASIVFPQFSDGAGWSTQLALINPTDTSVTGRFQFFGRASPDAPVSTLTMTVNGATGSLFDYMIPPRSTVRFVTANASSDIHTGYILATPEDGSVVPHGFSI